MSLIQESLVPPDAAAWLATRTPTDDDRDLILGTMRRWLAGEPVWPLADVFARWGGEFENYRRRWSRDDYSVCVQRETTMYRLRNDWITEFGFAIPCAELLEVLAKAQPVVEIGAGSGYMTALARKRGIDIVGTDAGPADELRYGFHVAKH